MKAGLHLQSSNAATSGFLLTRPIGMINVIMIIALFFNVFTQRVLLIIASIN